MAPMFKKVMAATKEIKNLNEWKKLTPSLYIRFDTGVTNQFMVRSNNHIIYLSEKAGKALLKEMKIVFGGENDKEKDT